MIMVYMEIKDTASVKGHLKIYKREIGKEWKLSQEVDNIFTTFGKQHTLGLLSGSLAGSISHFEFGAGGRETVDVSNASGATEVVHIFGTPINNQLSQTFYPATGTVSRVVIKPKANTGTPIDNVLVQLTHTSGTAGGNPTGTVVPTGTAITTQYVRGAYWNDYIGSEIALNIDTSVVIGSRYAIVVRNSGTTLDASNAFNLATWSGNGTDAYTSGNMATLSGTAWTQSGSQDYYFKVFYPTADNAPIAKTATSNALTIPTLSRAITSVSASGTSITVTCDVNTVQGNIPGKISEIRLRNSTTGSAITTTAFRPEDKAENVEMQIDWTLEL